MRGAGRLCRERPESFLAPREGNALSNLLRNDQMRRGGRHAGPEANALPHCALEIRRNREVLAGRLKLRFPPPAGGITPPEITADYTHRYSSQKIVANVLDRLTVSNVHNRIIQKWDHCRIISVLRRQKCPTTSLEFLIAAYRRRLPITHHQARPSSCASSCDLPLPQAGPR